MKPVWAGEAWTEEQIAAGRRFEKYIALGEHKWNGTVSVQKVPTDLAILHELRQLRAEVAALREKLEAP